MPADLTELYQSIILDHNRAPRNFRAMPDADHVARGHNPLCGDRLTVWLKLDGDVVADASFQGSGCAISKSSASLMTAALKGRTRSEVHRLRSFSMPLRHLTPLAFAIVRPTRTIVCARRR